MYVLLHYRTNNSTENSCTATHSRIKIFCKSNVTLQMKVTHDDQYLITVSNDACVMIWKIQDKEGRGIKRDKEVAYAEEILITKSDLEEKVTIHFPLARHRSVKIHFPLAIHRSVTIATLLLTFLLLPVTLIVCPLQHILL